MVMFGVARGLTLSGGNYNDTSSDMFIDDSSSDTTNQRSFNTANQTYNSGNNNLARNDFSKNATHNFRAGTVNNYNGAKNVNTGANYGAINQNDHRRAMPSWEPCAPQCQLSRGQGYRPPNHHAYSAPLAEHYHDVDRRPTYWRPEGAPQYQDRTCYRPPPQGCHRYPVDTRDDGYPRDDIYADIYEDEGEEFDPNGAHPLSAEGYTPASYPRTKSNSVASATSTSNASLQSGPPTPIIHNFYIGCPPHNAPLPPLHFQWNYNTMYRI